MVKWLKLWESNSAGIFADGTEFDLIMQIHVFSGYFEKKTLLSPKHD